MPIERLRANTKFEENYVMSNLPFSDDRSPPIKCGKIKSTIAIVKAKFILNFSDITFMLKLEKATF